MLIWGVLPCFEHVLADFVLFWLWFGTGWSAGQGDEGYFGADSYAGREDGFAESGVYMERLAVPGVEASVLLEHEAARAPA